MPALQHRSFGCCNHCLREKGLALEKLHGAITVDPIGELALDGELVRPLDEYYDEMAHSIAWAEKMLRSLKQ